MAEVLFLSTRSISYLPVGRRIMTAPTSCPLAFLESHVPHLERQIHSDVPASAQIVKQFHYSPNPETFR